jgi:hypothetical protein
VRGLGKGWGRKLTGTTECGTRVKDSDSIKRGRRAEPLGERERRNKSQRSKEDEFVTFKVSLAPS